MGERIFLTERWKSVINYTIDIKHANKGAKLVIWFGIVFLMVISCYLTSYAYVSPNNMNEVEPNDTQETAQTTMQNNEIAEKIAADDYSGRYAMYGKATSSDDDWYKVALTKGEHYLSVVHSYGDHATYVELLDSENNIIIPMKYGTRYNVTRFHSEGGTYYIHIVGASEIENQYTLFVGTTMYSVKELTVLFDSVTTSGTIRKSFSLADEEILPPDSVVSKIHLRSYSSKLSSASFTSSSSANNVVVNASSGWSSGNIGSLGMGLRSRWDLVIYPKQTVTLAPQIKFLFVYPVYDNTAYVHNPTIKK